MFPLLNDTIANASSITQTLNISHLTRGLLIVLTSVIVSTGFIGNFLVIFLNILL